MKFPINFSMLSGASTGLVIRAASVELVSLRGKNVASRVRVPIEGTDEQHVIQAIQNALSVAGLKTKKLAISITSRDVLFRFFTIPNMPKPEWDAAVQFEARRYIPFKTDSLVWDYRVIASSTSNQFEVVFCAMPRETFAQVQDMLSSAGIQPTVLESTSLSLARLVEPAKGHPPNEFACLVDVEEDCAHLAIVKDRMPYLTRDVSLRQSPPPPASGTVPAPEAGGAVPLPADTGSQASHEGRAAIDPRAERLLSELSMSMDFFMREHPSTTILRVLLFGDETVIGPWCRWLSEQLRCTVELGSPLVEQRVQGEVPLSFASAIGLLQAGKSANDATLDFLKRGAAKPASGRAATAVSGAPVTGVLASLKSTQTVLTAGLAAGLLGAVWFAGAMMVSSARQALAQAIRLRPDAGWGLTQMTKQDLIPIKEQAEKQLTLLKQMMDQRVSVAAKLDALARSLPDGVWLTGLSYEGSWAPGAKSQLHLIVSGACFLGGTGEELNVIQQFEEQVKRDPTFFRGFASAQLEQINAQVGGAQQSTYRTFQLSCNSERSL